MDYWTNAIADALPLQDVRAFVSVQNIDARESERVYPRMMLWQLENERYGLMHIPAVRRDRRLSAFCNALADLYRREAAGGIVSFNEFDMLRAAMEAAWVETGMRNRKLVGFLERRFAWVGGEALTLWLTRGWSGTWFGAFVTWLTHGWSETWIWAITAARKRGGGQTATLVWSWARAGNGLKPSPQYTERMRALRNHFLNIAHI